MFHYSRSSLWIYPSFLDLITAAATAQASGATHTDPPGTTLTTVPVPVPGPMPTERDTSRLTTSANQILANPSPIYGASLYRTRLPLSNLLSKSLFSSIMTSINMNSSSSSNISLKCHRDPNWQWIDRYRNSDVVIHKDPNWSISRRGRLKCSSNCFVWSHFNPPHSMKCLIRESRVYTTHSMIEAVRSQRGNA